jgi:hypothetical protein
VRCNLNRMCSRLIPSLAFSATLGLLMAHACYQQASGTRLNERIGPNELPFMRTILPRGD